MWKDLSIKEKSQVMQMAVQQGVTDLNEIRKLYDSSIDVTNVTPNNTYNNVPYYPSPEEVRYAYGGNIYKGGGKQRRRVDPDANNKAMFNKALPFYEEMISWGIDPMTAIGILGNMAQESSFVPTASYREHYGYIQNQTSIRDFIRKQYGGYGHKEQMQYIRDGLKGKLRGQNTPTGFQLQQRFNDYINNIGKVKTPAEAAALWEDSYEKSGEQNMKERQGYASYFYDRLRPYSVPRKAAASKPQIPVDTSIEKWSIEDALRNGGVTKFKVTSAHRTPEQQKKFKTKNSKHLIYLSNGTPAAMDIVPTDGDYDRLIREVANGSPEMHSYFAANNIGILDERSKEMRAKTGGTGKHLHIGLYDNPNGTMANTYRNWVTQYRTTPLDLHHPIQDVQWTPPAPIYDAGFDSGVGTELNPVELAEVAIVGNRKFTNPTQVERHEAEVDNALDYAATMNSEPLIPERSPSYIPELIMPNYTSVIKPLFAVNMDTPYTDYILGRRDNVAALGGKLFDEGGDTNPYIRNYQWRTMPETQSNYTDYDTGEPIQPGDKVWTNEQGQLVTANMPWAKEDWAVAHDRFAGSHELPELGIVVNKNTGEVNTYIGEQYDDYQQRMANAPIVSNTDLDKDLSWAYDQYQDFERQQYYNHLKNEKFGKQLDLMFGTPLYAALGLPAVAEGLGAGGAWLMAHPEITGPLLEGMIWGTGTDYAVREGSNNYYNGWGDFMHQQTGIGNEELWNWTNPGYFISPLTKSLTGAGETALKTFTDNAVRQMTYDSSPSLLTQYSRNMLGIEPQALSLYSNMLTNKMKSVSKDAGRELKDAAFILKNSIHKFDKGKVLPSLRGEEQILKSRIEGINKYLSTPREAYFTMPSNGLVVEGSPISGPVNLKGKITPDEWGGAVVDDGSIEVTEEITDALKNAGFPKDLIPNIGEYVTQKDLTYFNSILNNLNLQGTNHGNPELVREVNDLLQGFGHVTGSQISALEPYATHTPGDIDIVTTQKNLDKVIDILTETSGSATYLGRQDHIKINSPKYGEMDIQVIRNGNTPATSNGLIANETYSKLFPNRYSEKYTTEGEFPDLELSPEALLELHRKNIDSIVRIDQALSQKDKHVARDILVLGADDSKYAKRAMDEDLNVYRSVFGDKFKTLEDQGIHIDYTDKKSNLEFLHKLGVNNEIAEKLASDPIKMEYLIKSCAYEKTTTVRSIDKNSLLGDVNQENILAAIHTNTSYANHGGNTARGKFGGDNIPSYAGSEGVTAAFQLPIRNGKKIHNAMDFYNEVYRYATGPEYTAEAKLQERDFAITDEQAKELKELLNLDKLPRTINDIVPYTDRDNLISRLNKNDLTDKEQIQFASDINNKISDILGIDYVFSNQPRFGNQYIGITRSNIPGQISTLQSAGYNYPNFYGFELPHHKFDIMESKDVNVKFSDSPEMSSFEDLTNKKLGFTKERLGRKFDRAKEKKTDAQNDLHQLNYYTDRKIENTRKALVRGGVSTIPLSLAYLYNRVKGKPYRDTLNIKDSSGTEQENYLKKIEEDYGFSNNQMHKIRNLIKQQNWVELQKYLNYWE